MQGLVYKNKAVVDLLARHALGLAPHKQLLLGLRMCGGRPNQAFREMIAKHGKSILPTLLIEDPLKVQRVDGQTKGIKGFRKPEVSMAGVLKVGVCAKRRKSSPVGFEVAPRSASDPLGRHWFEGLEKNAHMDVQAISSTSRSPGWWSPFYHQHEILPWFSSAC